MKSLASRILKNQFVVVVENDCEMLFSSIKLNNNSTVCDIMIAYTGVLCKIPLDWDPLSVTYNDEW